MTKYEMLQHRHLSLLKELEAAGVSANCNETGKWHIGVPAGIICNAFGEKYPIIGFNPNVVRERYAEGVWSLTNGGEVTFQQDSIDGAPEWVKAKRKQWKSVARTPPTVPAYHIECKTTFGGAPSPQANCITFLDGEKRAVQSLTKVKEGYYSVPRGAEFIAYTFGPFSMEMTHPAEALANHMFICNYEVSVRHGGKEMVCYDHALKETFRAPIDPVTDYLLTALRAAIVAASPAKVD